MTLVSGARLGPYEIISPIGAGGMGEVYRGRDARLNRDVALKVLPEVFAKDAERMARFEREAQVLASLNHPNIAQLYGLEERALVMEYVPGETLEGIGPLPVDEALHLARQIAEALEYAHEKGIVHRDLKPANIKITPEGQVKVLDFGLAKALDDEPESVNPSHSPTLSLAATRAGVILGTAGYMSPEQARGAAVDKRADIWSFGVVLYEMLTGRHTFHGETVSDTLAAVLKTDPDWSALPAGAPVRLLRRCLERDRKQRLRDIGDVRLEIDEILHAPPEQRAAPAPAAAPPKSRERLAWAAAAGLFLAVLAVSFLHFREKPAEVRPVRFQIFPPPKTTYAAVDSPVLSPDGHRLVFSAGATQDKPSLWLRSLDTLAAQPLPGTEAGYLPFWSPDGRFIAFFADQKLKKVDTTGAPPQTLCDIGPGRGGTWSQDGTILFASVGNPLRRVPAAGGEPKPVLRLDSAPQEMQIYPWFLPDGRHFLYYSGFADAGKSGIRSGSLDSAETRPVLAAQTNFAFAPPGFLLFARQQTLMAQAFDAGKLHVSGDPFPVAEGVGRFVGTGARFSVSQTGVLVWRGGGSASTQIASYTRDGKRLAAAGEPRSIWQFSLSPDEKRLALEVADTRSNNRDIWLLELTGSIFSRVTSDPATETDPVWSPDGRELVFASSRKGRPDLYRKVVGGPPEELLLESADAKYPAQWLPGGSIGFLTQNGKSFFRLPLAGDRKPVLLFQSEFDKDQLSVSPDGRWVAYNSSESGRPEVYIASFPGFTERRQISNSSGCQPLWRKDGKELFYLTLEAKVMSVDIKGAATPEAGVPRQLFAVPVRVNPILSQYAVTADGRKFYFLESLDEGPVPMTVTLNWTTGLTR
jgi:Tol biopolymer transport system component/predicted Ser/Thr protein kinase